MKPGELYDTGVATVGGRGQQAVTPHPGALHTVTMTSIVTTTHADHYLSAEEALMARARRLKESGTPHERDGMTLTFADSSGASITLTYEEGQL